MRPGIRGLVLLAWFAAIPGAAAAPRASSLSWVRLEGAEACIAAPDLSRAVEARLDRTVFVPPSNAEVAVEGRVEVVTGAEVHWRAVLKLTDSAGASLGDRVVESRAETCDELGRVATVAIALMVDPPDAAPVEPPPGEIEREPPLPRWTIGIDGSLLAGAGAVPGVGVGGIAFVRVRPPRFVPIVAEGELIPFARSESSAGRVDFTRMVGGLQVCPLAVARGAVTLDGCLGVDAGVLFVLDTSAPLDATEKVLVQASGSVTARWNVVGPLVLRAGLHPVVPLRPVSFALADGTEVFAPAPVGGFLDVGIGVTF